jgi:uncharacterized protein YwgA
MTKYQLAKLIHWVGTLETRKRMQKVVYLLQAAGCPFGADFFLHRFGPYSQEVAQLTDELVAAGVLQEIESENAVGHQFGYSLTKQGETLLSAFESRSLGQSLSKAMAKYEPLAKQLATNELKELEVASTIAYYRQTVGNWDLARESACRFKQIRADTSFARNAEALAKSVVG